MGYILTTDNITKKFKYKVAVNQVSIHVERGEVYGLIGKNGAGKTTLLKMIANLSFPTSGSYTLHGENGETQQEMMKRIGVLIEDPGIFPNLSAMKNLKAKAIAYGVKNDNYLHELLQFVGLADVGEKPVKNFSLGMRQRLGIALAMVNSPELLLLDEPINGLDPQGIAEIRGVIHRLCTELHTTVIISSHILEELSKVASRYGIIHNGQLIDELTKEELNARCTPHIFIRTKDATQTSVALQKIGVTQYEFKEDHFEINERLDQISELNIQLARENVQITELRLEGQSLEEYYFRLTGGNTNV